ncbi:MAG TPA: GntR family transcriptional regulator [Gemmataceae bacterium]|jgi:GntR family transcriptional regulator|nr:GntR family transcriptional regulator [Gemmataceae bacterium]
MFFTIHPDSPVPIYEQIVAQVTFCIASGAVEAGALIPSVRDLAAKLLVHPNTVARAFQELERQGIVTAKRGRGMEVTAVARQVCQEQRHDILRGRIRELLREAASSALPTSEIRRLVREELARSKKRRRSREKREWTASSK